MDFLRSRIDLFETNYFKQKSKPTTERSKLVCGFTSDGLGNSNYTADDLCEGLSVFWFANIHNYIHDNVAVGGNAGYWLFTHSAYVQNQFDAIPVDPETGVREWRNNKACCTSRGFAVDESILDEEPNEEFPSKGSLRFTKFFISIEITAGKKTPCEHRAISCSNSLES